MRFIFALLAAAAFAATPAMAEDTGFYVGASVGDAGLEIDGFDGSDFGFKLYGGYQFMRYLAAEVEYIDGGKPDDGGIEIDVYGFNVSGMGILPIGEQFEVFAKLGMLFWDADAEGIGSDSGEDFSWGIGAGYWFTDQFAIRGEYQGFDLEDADGDLLSVGLTWKF